MDLSDNNLPGNPELISFSCFGTLVDWRTGIVNTLQPLLEDYLISLDENEIFDLFTYYENEITCGDFMYYRTVLSEVVHQIGRKLNVNLTADDRECLIRELPSWKLYKDTLPALHLLKRSFKIALICNGDMDLLEKTILNAGIKFDVIITSESIRNYKPSQNLFIKALRTFKLPSDRIMHVSQNLSKDILPCNELGIPVTWINRYHHPLSSDPQEIARYEFKDLTSFANAFSGMKQG
jgi:2-haloalkanoic acid dehalogenase type II